MIGRWTAFGVSAFLLLAGGAAAAGALTVEAVEIIEWKSVYGVVETRDRAPARARIGGVLGRLNVSAGDRVEAGEEIALVEDDKLAFELASLDARLDALRARRAIADADLARGRTLLERGVVTAQRMDQLRAEVDVLGGEIRSLDAERLAVMQRVAEGAVLSPPTGVVLSAPLARGSVTTPGETVAEIGGGGVFLRLALPERHAEALSEGDEILIGGESGARRSGRLVKLYPRIEEGRVLADVEVAGLDARFIGRRVPVRLPVGARRAILAPAGALSTRNGLDYIHVEGPDGVSARVVTPGGSVERDGEIWREILTGLRAGERVATPDE